MGKEKLDRKCPIYSELGDVGRVLDPGNSRRTSPPAPGPPATLSQLGPWSSVSEERARTCRFHSFRRPCRPESCCSRPASVPSCLPGSWVPVGLRGAVPW